MAVNSPLTPAGSAAPSDMVSNFWGDDGFSFGDILDLINPFQHIPIIGTIYRAITGDQISTGSSILGGGLFGGIIGAGIAVVNAVIEEVTGGGGIGGHIMAMFEAEETPPDAPVGLASAASPGEDGDGGAPAGDVRISDSPSPEPASATAPPPAVPASAERQARLEAAATRVTISKVPAPLIPPTPIAPTPEVAAIATAPRPVMAPEHAAPASPTAQAAATVGQPAAPPDRAWLTAIPRAEGDFTTAALRYMTPDSWRQLVLTITENPERQLTRGPSEITRDAINRYSQRAIAAKAMMTQPAVIDMVQ
jgi:hypothetical protein